LIGFVGFATLTFEREWTVELYTLLPNICNIIANLFQRQEVEQELRLQRDFAIQIMNAMGQGLVVGDENGKFEYINPAFANMLGYLQEELIGKFPADITHPSDLAIIDHAQENRKRGNSDVYEARIRRKNGGELVAMINAVPLLRHGQVQGSIAVEFIRHCIRSIHQPCGTHPRFARDGLPAFPNE
jgi:PAS domain S-box-containing protein